MSKRIYLSVLYLCLFIQGIYSQIEVKSFRLLENDLTANTHATMVKDRNGAVAALIKVVTTERGFTFEAGMTGIVKVKQEVGEIWVYVPSPLSRITIRHPQHGVLRDYYFDIPIESARTYELVLSTPTSPANTRKGLLELIYSPLEANVFIDGISFPTMGNGSLITTLDYGSHSYQIAAERFETQEGTFIIDSTKTSLQIELSELPPPAPQEIIENIPQEPIDSFPINTTSNNTTQRFRGGIVAGLNSNMPINHGTDDITHRFAIGVQIGAQCEIGLPSTTKGPFLDFGMQLALPTSKVNDFYSEAYQGWGYGYTRPCYLTIPMHLGYRFNYNADIKLSCSAGLYYSYLIGGVFDFKIIDDNMFFTTNLRPYLLGTYAPFDYGASLRIGAEFHNRLQLSIGYDIGLHDIGYAGMEHYNDYPDIKLRNNIFNVSCTYLLPRFRKK